MENGSYNPVNPKAPLKGKAAEEQNKMNTILKTAVALDWDVINAERPEHRLDKPRPARWRGIGNREITYRRPGRGGHPERASGVSGMAHCAGTRARRTRAPLGRSPAHAQGSAGRTGVAGGGQDHLRGPGRSAGDDRHLRLRRRSVAATAWPDHRQRAPWAPDDGNVASDGRGGHHLGVQFSGGGVVVERRARPGVRQRHRVEAVGENAAHRHRLSAPDAAGGRRVQCREAGRHSCRTEPTADWRARRGRSAGGQPPGAGGQRHGLDAHGPPSGREGGRALRPLDPGAGRQQRDDRHAVGGSGTGRARHHVCRRRHRGPTLHVAATFDRAPLGGRYAAGSPGKDLPEHRHWRPAG
ncbi:hypothetical protein Lal_00014665 [Lupinus albus]|nr:hypothetical protein Lal_00014665 [Lupinus albus]